MVHVHGGYLLGRLRDDPLPLDCALYPLARLSRLLRGGEAGLTRRRGDGVGCVGACGSCSGSRWYGLREGLCGTQSRQKVSRLSESVQPLRQQRK